MALQVTRELFFVAYSASLISKQSFMNDVLGTAGIKQFSENFSCLNIDLKSLPMSGHQRLE